MAYIPAPIEHKETAINQHLVPRCYMKAWAYNESKKSVWLFEKDASVHIISLDDLCISFDSKKTERIGSIDNYYDIKAGAYFMPQEALDELFGPTMHLIVSFNGELLDSEIKRNEKYSFFDEWNIRDESGCDITKKERDDLKLYFQKSRYVFIEKQWGKQYESNWESYVNNLQDIIMLEKSVIACKTIFGDTKSSIISSKTINDLIKHMIIYNIRGFSSDEYLSKVIDEVFDLLPSEFADMPLNTEDRIHPIESTPRQTFKHQYTLQLCYDILKNKKMTGTTKRIWEKYCENLVPRFCLTTEKVPFLTSERPAFINSLDNGQKEYVFVVLPTLLVSFGRGDKGQFFISNMSEMEVNDYNLIIINNNKYIISISDKI